MRIFHPLHVKEISRITPALKIDIFNHVTSVVLVRTDVSVEPVSSNFKVKGISEVGTLAVINKILSNLKMEATCTSETLVPQRPILRPIQEGICHCRENLTIYVPQHCVL
jgi:hypothetical protein